MGRLDLGESRAHSTIPAAPGDVIAFAVLGDFGVHDPDLAPSAVREIERLAETCPDCNFVVLAGDNVYPNGVATDGDTRGLDAIADAIELPVVSVLGNHDWGAFAWPFGGANHNRARRQLEWIDTRADVAGASHFWTFEVGPIQLLGIDSTWVDRRCRSGCDGLAGLFPDRDGRWRIIAAHHPLMSDGAHGNAGGALSRWMATWRPDLIVSGHDHDLQVHDDGTRLQLVSGSAAKQRALRQPSATSLLGWEGPGVGIVRANRDNLSVSVYQESRCATFVRVRGGPTESVPCP